MTNNANSLKKIKNAVKDKTRRNPKVLKSGIIQRKNIDSKEDTERMNQPVKASRGLFDNNNLDGSFLTRTKTNSRRSCH